MLTAQAPLALLLSRGPEDLSIPAPLLVPFRHLEPIGSAVKAAPEASPGEGRSAVTDVIKEANTSSDATVQPAADTLQPSTGASGLLPLVDSVASGATVWLDWVRARARSSVKLAMQSKARMGSRAGAQGHEMELS
jgi:hypothetical protein